jgi:hypothetical protein
MFVTILHLLQAKPVNYTSVRHIIIKMFLHSIKVIEKETKGSLEPLNDTLSHKTKLILELKTTVNKMNAMLQQLEAEVSKQ